MKVSPAAIGIRANASYGALTVFVVYNSEGASVFAVAPSVTITKAILNTNGNGNLNFGSNKSINNEEVSGASTPDAPNSIVGPIVGAIVGMIVLLGIIAYIAYLKKNNRVIAAKKKKNEMYQACLPAVQSDVMFSSTPLDNPNYSVGVQERTAYDSVDNFLPGLQNPLYAWYRPDLSRAETEEFLSHRDIPEGTFLIRDSSATHGMFFPSLP